jgi:tRNA (cmo5U34)-methyltransferase
MLGEAVNTAAGTPAEDTGYAPEEWAFDAEVTRVFDSMLRRSIPDYEVMRDVILDLGSRFVQRASWIVDIGCSRGEAMAPFVDRFGAQNRFLGLDVSEPMTAAARERFAGMIDAGIVSISTIDLREAPLPSLPSSLFLSVFTLQFVPMEYRQQIVADVHERLLPGGALILAEKVAGSTALMQRTLVTAYHDLKHRNGYSWDDIDRKRRSLEGKLVPLSAEWNERLLVAAGFRHVECIWRRYNFAAWLAVKG